MRLRTLLLTNNRLTRVDAGFADMCPQLESLLLTNNKLSKLEDLTRIAASCKSLQRLSLLGNLVTQLPNYRLYVIHLIPSLRVLDFQKVTSKERQEATRRFDSAQAGATQLLKDLKEREAAINSSETGGATIGAVGKKRRASEREGADGEEEVQRKIAEVEKMIELAKSIEEVTRLQMIVEELQGDDKE